MDEFNKFSKFFDQKKVDASQIEEALKSRFTKYYGNPDWAQLDSDKTKKKKSKKKKDLFKINKTGKDEEKDTDNEEDNSDDDDDGENFFQQTGNFLDTNKTSSVLPKTILDIKVCTDANKEDPNQVKYFS